MTESAVLTSQNNPRNKKLYLERIEGDAFVIRNTPRIRNAREERNPSDERDNYNTIESHVKLCDDVTIHGRGTVLNRVLGQTTEPPTDGSGSGSRYLTQQQLCDIVTWQKVVNGSSAPASVVGGSGRAFTEYRAPPVCGDRGTYYKGWGQRVQDTTRSRAKVDVDGQTFPRVDQRASESDQNRPRIDSDKIFTNTRRINQNCIGHYPDDSRTENVARVPNIRHFVLDDTTKNSSRSEKICHGKNHASVTKNRPDSCVRCDAIAEETSDRGTDGRAPGFHVNAGRYEHFIKGKFRKMAHLKSLSNDLLHMVTIDDCYLIKYNYCVNVSVEGEREKVDARCDNEKRDAISGRGLHEDRHVTNRAGNQTRRSVPSSRGCPGSSASSPDSTAVDRGFRVLLRASDTHRYETHVIPSRQKRNNWVARRAACNDAPASRNFRRMHVTLRELVAEHVDLKTHVRAMPHEHRHAFKSEVKRLLSQSRCSEFSDTIMKRLDTI